MSDLNEDGAMLKSKEHYDLMAKFERAFKGCRLDREPKDLWPMGVVYQDGHVNELFRAYRQGYSYAACLFREPMVDDARCAAALAAELDRYRALYEQERADRIMLQQVERSQALTIETQRVMLQQSKREKS